MQVTAHDVSPRRPVYASDTEIIQTMASRFQSLWNVAEGSDNLKVRFCVGL